MEPRLKENSTLFAPKTNQRLTARRKRKTCAVRHMLSSGKPIYSSVIKLHSTDIYKPGKVNGHK